MPFTPKKPFKLYRHSPFSFTLNGVRGIVESNGKVSLRQGDGDEVDVIDTSAGFMLKLFSMLKADRPLTFTFADIKVEFLERGKIEIKQGDLEGYDMVTTSDAFVRDFTKMLLATRSEEWVDSLNTRTDE